MQPSLTERPYLRGRSKLHYSHIFNKVDISEFLSDSKSKPLFVIQILETDIR